jgi:hypothetical protein
MFGTYRPHTTKSAFRCSSVKEERKKECVDLKRLRMQPI